MKKPTYVLGVAVILAALLATAGIPLSGSFAAAPAATSPVGLGTAGDFAVLAASAVNDTNVSAVIGNVGLSPAAWPPAPALTCLEVTGTVYSVNDSGPLPCRVTNAGLLTTAKNDLTTAYNDAAGRTATTIATQLGGTTRTDGVYRSEAGTFEIVSGGTLTLDGGGNADSVFIFKTESTLTTFSDSKVALINGAQACNVFWQVGSSAVLGTRTDFAGTIMADQSISDNGYSTVSGRFLARIAAATLNHTSISRPICNQASTPTATPTATMTPGGPALTPTATATSTATPTGTPPRTPPEVPEASTFLLMGSGLGALATWLGWQRASRGRSKRS